MLSYMIFLGAEGVIVSADQTATSTSTSTLQFPVTLIVNTEIDLSCPASVLMPAISGLTGGPSSATADCNVKTNSANGYYLYVHASSTPALKSSTGSFGDHPYTTVPQFTWALASTATSTFGFAASSTDVTDTFKSTASTCNSNGGTISVSNCFRGFNGISDLTVSHGTTPTSAGGTTTTLNFKAEVGSTASQAAGTYTANITVTAVAI